MNRTPDVPPNEDAQALRSRLRADLVAAMKARQPEVVSALRTAIAAIDNAEAIEVHDSVGALGSKHFAGAQAGVGSTEAVRRVLSLGDIRALLEAQVSDRIAEADRYDGFDQRAAASRLRREADVLRRYLAT